MMATVQALTLRHYIVDPHTLSAVLCCFPNLKYLELDRFRLGPALGKYGSISLPPNFQNSDIPIKTLDRLTFKPDMNISPGVKLQVLSYLLRYFSVGVLELRSFGFGGFNPSIATSEFTHDFSQGVAHEIEELDIEIMTPPFLSLLRRSLCSATIQPKITCLSIYLSMSQLDLDHFNDLLLSMGHNLGELSLRLRWLWSEEEVDASESDDDSVFGMPPHFFLTPFSLPSIMPVLHLINNLVL